MLVITRKPGESFYVGDTKIELLTRKGNCQKIGIDAPKDITILREELLDNGTFIKEEVTETEGKELNACDNE